jgi:hypothetical protein
MEGTEAFRAAVAEEEEDVFETGGAPFRIALSKALSREELVRRRDYFEKQLLFVNELLLDPPPVVCAASSSTMIIASELPLSQKLKEVPLNWNGNLETDGTLKVLDEICEEFESAEQARVRTLVGGCGEHAT